MNGISILIPTVGRESIRATFDSFGPDLTAEDAVLVGIDGYKPEAVDWLKEAKKKYAGRWQYVINYSFPMGHTGHPMRNLLLGQVPEGDYIWTIDDDDVAMPGALDVLRQHLSGWAIFKMTFGEGHYANGLTLWRYGYLMLGDIGTPMILAPKCSARFGSRYEGDWDYALELQRELGNPTFNDEVIAHIRPVKQ